MSTNDQEIRVAIVATADGAKAGTTEASAAIEGFNAQVQATQAEAADANDPK